MRVLLVEDDADCAEVLREIFACLGHSCDVARTGRDALSHARAFAPDLVMIDLGLPDTSGCEVARELRARGDSPVVVAISGYGDCTHRRAAAEAGCVRYMVKPVSMSGLRELMAAVSES